MKPLLKKQYIIPFIIIAVISIGASYWYSKNHKVITPNSTSTQTNRAGIDSNSGANNDPSTNSVSNNVTNKSKPPPRTNPDSSANGGTADVNVSITSADIIENDLRVRTIINAVDNTGSCKLTMTKPGSTTITQTSDVQALASTSTCKGFSVPINNLAHGTWVININFNSSIYKGAANKSITL